jgi:MerR family transcriptional regulator, light-induced transcriptional regulator
MGDEREHRPRAARDERIDELSRAYAVAILAGDEVAAEQAVRQAMEAGLSSAEVDDGIVAPALWLVGELWERGEITVADEHLATEITVRVLALQAEARRVVGQRPHHRVMLATPSGEHHDVALRMLDQLLRAGGYQVLMLGSDVPPHALADFAGRYRPDVVCLSSTMPGGSDELLMAFAEVQRACPGAGFLVGGRGVTSRVRPLRGVDTRDSVSDALEAVDALVRRADAN